ncbi:MAG: helix-turn-helix domain-containing protein [Gemmatimonadota bacterium]
MKKSKKMAKEKKRITADEFDRRFDAGEDLDDYVDWSESALPGIAELAGKARAVTGLSQAAFAERYGIPFSTFRDWEQGKRMADAAGRSYLRVIAQLPDAVARALGHAA